ncbi:MAG: hypothetical protein AB1921_19590 [Thermodesulfobacteriota bacterium]
MRTRIFHSALTAAIAAAAAYGLQHLLMGGEVDPHLVYVSGGAGAVIGLMFGHSVSDALRAMMSIR